MVYNCYILFWLSAGKSYMMKKRVIAILISLCMILPTMFIPSYGAEATYDTVVLEENSESKPESRGIFASIFTEVEDDGHDIFDLFEGEFMKDSNEKRILNYMFITFVIVIIVRLLLLFVGVI